MIFPEINICTKNKNDIFFIYVLWSEDEGIKYVGKTNNPHKRFKEHISNNSEIAKKNIFKYMWIKERRDKVLMNVIYETTKEEEVFSKEIEIISFLKEKKVKLLNITTGRDGASKDNYTYYLKKKQSESKKEFYKNNPEKLEKLKEIGKRALEKYRMSTVKKPGPTKHALEAAHAKRKIFNKEQETEIVRLYLEEKIGACVLAGKFGVCQTTILNVLKKYNIKRRNLKEARKYNSRYSLEGKEYNTKTYLIRKEIIHKYTVENKSTIEIGKEYGLCAGTILQVLKSNGIKIKTAKEARRFNVRYNKDGTEKDKSIYYKHSAIQKQDEVIK